MPASSPGLTEADVRRRLESLAKPPGSLGRLEDLAVELALAAGTLEVATRPRRLVVFAADHGVVDSGVSAWPRTVTTAMARTVHAGRASCSALGRAAGCSVRLVDVGIETPLRAAASSTYAERRVVAVSGDLADEAALTREQLHAAWDVGVDEGRAGPGRGRAAAAHR